MKLYIDYPLKMGNIIKNFRLNNNIKSIDLAKHLGKSPAYITKLENGLINSIDDSILNKIINFITNGENSVEELYQEYASKVSKDEYEKDLFFMNFDYNHRLVPVPSNLIMFINDKLDKHSINSETIIEYINTNEDIMNDPYIIKLKENKKIQFNEWIRPKENINNVYYIYLKYPLNEYNNLLKKKQRKETYMFVYSFVYHLLKYEEKIEKNEIDTEKIKKYTEQVLFNYKFLSLEAKINYMDVLLGDDYSEITTVYDLNYRNEIKKFLDKITTLSDYDILSTTKRLKQINNSFDNSNNYSFVLAYLSLDLSNTYLIKDKAKFIKELQLFINNYNEENEDVDEFY